MESTAAALKRAACVWTVVFVRSAVSAMVAMGLFAAYAAPSHTLISPTSAVYGCGRRFAAWLSVSHAAAQMPIHMFGLRTVGPSIVRGGAPLFALSGTLRALHCYSNDGIENDNDSNDSNDQTDDSNNQTDDSQQDGPRDSFFLLLVAVCDLLFYPSLLFALWLAAPPRNAAHTDLALTTISRSQTLPSSPDPDPDPNLNSSADPNLNSSADPEQDPSFNLDLESDLGAERDTERESQRDLAAAPQRSLPHLPLERRVLVGLLKSVAVFGVVYVVVYAAVFPIYLAAGLTEKLLLRLFAFPVLTTLVSWAELHFLFAQSLHPDHMPRRYAPAACLHFGLHLFGALMVASVGAQPRHFALMALGDSLGDLLMRSTFFHRIYWAHLLKSLPSRIARPRHSRFFTAADIHILQPFPSSALANPPSLSPSLHQAPPSSSYTSRRIQIPLVPLSSYRRHSRNSSHDLSVATEPDLHDPRFSANPHQHSPRASPPMTPLSVMSMSEAFSLAMSSSSTSLPSPNIAHLPSSPSSPSSSSHHARDDSLLTIARASIHGLSGVAAQILHGALPTTQQEKIENDQASIHNSISLHAPVTDPIDQRELALGYLKLFRGIQLVENTAGKLRVILIAPIILYIVSPIAEANDNQLSIHSPTNAILAVVWSLFVKLAFDMVYMTMEQKVFRIPFLTPRYSLFEAMLLEVPISLASILICLRFYVD
eukprot:TRINITY_DN937_c1_g1_i1.p1 TRINITY_DN937_c1_g1~~TRINITY_DN937_c1_g1_i1.p1  ORF type:complete len:711 (+),score=127.75 TRINITY_DN937_c1_g1_i1:30-2162(+)